MSENKLPLIFQTGRLNYIFLPLPFFLIPLMGIFFFFNFADDPTIPSPLIPPLVGAAFILIGLVISWWAFLKMKQKLAIDEQQIKITTFRGSSLILPWEIVTSLEVVFTGKINVAGDLVEGILAALPSDPVGGAQIKLTSGPKTDAISFMRIYLKEVKQLVDTVNSITNIEPTEKQAGMKKTIWSWNFQI